MKFIADIHLNMRTPELEAPEGMAEPAVKLWLVQGLKMPLEMVKAISIEKVSEVKP